MKMKFFFFFFFFLSLNDIKRIYCNYLEILLEKYTPENLNEILIETENKFIKTKYQNIFLLINDKNALPNSIGHALDKFITPRPWWYIVKEPYGKIDSNNNDNNNSNNNNHNNNEPLEIKLNYVGDEYAKVLKLYTSIQFPEDCTDKLLRISLTGGFDSFGNNFYNYNALQIRFPMSIISPYIIDRETTSTSFLSHHYCPHIDNKFECAFLPSTTCPLPSIETVEFNHTFYYKTSQSTSSSSSSTTTTTLPKPVVMPTLEFEELNKQRAHENKDKIDINIPTVISKKYSNLFSPNGPNEDDKDPHHKLTLFTYAILFRLNYVFRSQVYHQINRFKSTLTEPFPTGNCVAIHIRRNKDRAPYELRGNKIIEWCNKYKTRPDHTCWDDEKNDYVNKGDCVHSYDYGCHTANPYGALTLENYLNASNVFPSKINNIYLRTDDDIHVREELKNYKGNKHIFYFPADHDHRKGSTSSGVSYLAAIELARECNGGFVGHTGSAVTNLFLSLLCVRHANTFGECPPFFDFAS